MKEFTHDELSMLCSLYMEGKLSKNEEKQLYLLLEKSVALPDDCENVLNLMKVEEKVFSKRKNKTGRVWKYSSVAASFLVVVALIAILQRTPSTSSDNEEIFIVWQDGKKIEGEEARRIAEEEQLKHMQMIREIMKKQREMLKRNFASADLNEADF